MQHPYLALFFIAAALTLLTVTVSFQFAALMGLPIAAVFTKLQKSHWRKP